MDDSIEISFSIRLLEAAVSKAERRVSEAKAQGEAMAPACQAFTRDLGTMRSELDRLRRERSAQVGLG
ncbi:MAG: hypothetical protein JWP22_4394 [Ramlibacter sp.]|jgi:hypothetical protein|nr:hypothetical protein [Ramlibacter sp.]MDB5915719.1 hypothetical protein [Ramlibacter sp.]